MKSAFVILLILFFIAFSISSDLKTDIQIEEEQQYEEYSFHTDSSERLANIMQQISSIAETQQGSELIEFTEEEMTDLTEAVEELLFFAELMALKVPATENEESKNVIFSAVASKLYDETLNIQQLIKSYNLDATDYSEKQLFSEAFNRLRQTCNACHQYFREK